MIAVVIKGFTQGGKDIRPGSIVDTTGWRNGQRMLQARHIRPASASEITDFEKQQAKRTKAA